MTWYEHHVLGREGGGILVTVVTNESVDHPPCCSTPTLVQALDYIQKRTDLVVENLLVDGEKRASIFWHRYSEADARSLESMDDWHLVDKKDFFEVMATGIYDEAQDLFAVIQANKKYLVKMNDQGLPTHDVNGHDYWILCDGDKESRAQQSFNVGEKLSEMQVVRPQDLEDLLRRTFNVEDCVLYDLMKFAEIMRDGFTEEFIKALRRHGAEEFLARVAGYGLDMRDDERYFVNWMVEVIL